jgi:DTW domain-containing protein YfiP
MLKPLCICDYLVPFATKSRLVLLIHWSEIPKPANSGRIAQAMLTNHETHVIGDPFNPMNWEDVCQAECENLFLFPSPDAEVLSPELVATFERPIRLIVADGNWGQASRMHRRLSQVSAPRKVILPQGPKSEYRLRSAPDRREGVSTLEAIARALATIESPDVADALLGTFRIMVDRSLFARGKLSRDLVRGGIPYW